MARPRVDRAIGPLARETFQNNEEWLRDTFNTPGLEEFKEHFGAFVPDARDEDQTRAQANAALDWVLAEVAKELAADNTGQGDNLLPDICLKICEYLKGKLAPQQKGGSRKRVALPEAKKDELKLWRAFLRTLLVDQPGMDGACALPLHRVAALLRERGPRVGAALQVTSSFNLALPPPTYPGEGRLKTGEPETPTSAPRGVPAPPKTARTDEAGAEGVEEAISSKRLDFGAEATGAHEEAPQTVGELPMVRSLLVSGSSPPAHTPDASSPRR